MAYSDPPPETFGKRLKRLAKERGLSNKALAEKTGAHIVTVSRWMGGSIPEGPTLIKVADALDVLPADLFPEEVKHQPTKRPAYVIEGKSDVEPAERPRRRRKKKRA